MTGFFTNASRLVEVDATLRYGSIEPGAGCDAAAGCMSVSHRPSAMAALSANISLGADRLTSGVLLGQARLLRYWVGLLAFCGAVAPVLAQVSVAPPGGLTAVSEPAALPDFAALEAAGAVIGEIRIRNEDIFDTTDPQEDKWLFRLANRLHIVTRPSVIERSLLFKSGEPVSVRLIEETERVLRDARYLYDVKVRPVAYRDGVVDLEVLTRDTWSLDPGISAGRSGGANSSGINLRDYNLLGTGIGLSLGHSRNVDRSSNEFNISNDRAFGGWTSMSYSRSDNSDGKREAVSVAQPFYALDAIWAGGISVSKDNRIDAVYTAGEISSQYRHEQKLAELSGGWSEGRVNGWVRRYSVGLSHREDLFALEPGVVAPAALPQDQKLVAPYLRFDIIEDRFEKLLNRNQIGRPEFFAIGLNARLQLGRASTAFGSSRNAWLYSGSISRGFEPREGDTLTAAASFDGEYSARGVRNLRLSASTQYYLPQSPRRLFYASASADTLVRPEVNDSLLLGGDNGLRGYPLRYQSGVHRALFTVEQRFYTDLYLLRLLRVGGAAYLDTGRAWGGGNVNSVNPGWLSNLGFGLRLFSVRAAFGNVLHADIAMPLDSASNAKRVQFLVKTRTSF
jgi:hypothetical protein